MTCPPTGGAYGNLLDVIVIIAVLIYAYKMLK